MVDIFLCRSATESTQEKRIATQRYPGQDYRPTPVIT